VSIIINSNICISLPYYKLYDHFVEGPIDGMFLVRIWDDLCWVKLNDNPSKYNSVTSKYSESQNFTSIRLPQSINICHKSMTQQGTTTDHPDGRLCIALTQALTKECKLL